MKTIEIKGTNHVSHSNSYRDGPTSPPSGENANRVSSKVQKNNNNNNNGKGGNIY